MNRNDIRPSVIGVAAALAAFGGIYVWLEYEPWEHLAGVLARRQLTPQERAELDRINAEKQADHQLCLAGIEKRKAESAARDAAVAEGFNPDLLTLPEAVTSPQELDLTELVAEIEHAEHLCDNADYRLADPHRQALHLEFARRKSSWFMHSRADQLRLDIAHDRVAAIQRRRFAASTPLASGADPESVVFDLPF